MFKNPIYETPLNTPEAGDYFGRITGMAFQGDISFIATLRALLANRMPEEDSIFLDFNGYTYSQRNLSSLSPIEATATIFDTCYDKNNSLQMKCFMSADQDANNAWIKVLVENVERMYSGWHRVEKVNSFFKKVCNIECFVNPDIKSTVLITDNIDMRKYHYIQQGTLAFLPWYFDKEAGVSDLEMELLKSLSKKTSEDYEAVLEKIASQYNFAEIRIRKLLDGFENAYERHRCDEVRHDLEGLMENINQLKQRIGDYLRRKNEVEITLLGLETKLAQNTGESEIMDYFLTNKALSLQEVSGTKITFVVRSTLDYFDEDMASRFLENTYSSFYEGCGHDFSKADMKLLMRALFVEQTLRMQFCAAYRLDVLGNVDGIRGYSYGSNCRNYMPNPHVNRYACLGGNERATLDCLENHNYIAAIEQCITSCKSLNFADSAVMRVFSDYVANRGDGVNNRCIVMPDGSIATPKEAVAWLKKQNQTSEEVA